MTSFQALLHQVGNVKIVSLNKFKIVNSITINGKNIISSGSVIVSNGKVIVGGVDVTPEGKEITIIVDGNVDKLEVDVCSKVTITGNANTVRMTNGNVEIQGAVSGDVTTTNGSVDCGDIAGSVSTTNGDIKHRKK